MKMNAGTWIGIIGGIVGMVVAVGATLATGGSSGIYIASGVVLFFALMFFIFYKLLFQQMILASRLKKEGIPGKAVIKEVHDTGVTVNNSPQIKLILEVKNTFGQVYTTTVRTLISRLQPQLYEPGMTVPVLIDPKDENKVVIDYSGGGSQAKAAATYNNTAAADVNTAAITEGMMKLQQEDDAIRLTGKEAKAIIKKYTWLGIYINGNNPYAEIEMEVLPEDEPAFEAKVKNLISEQSVAKYQPGQTVYVKYDPADQSRVAMFHS